MHRIAFEKSGKCFKPRKIISAWGLSFLLLLLLLFGQTAPTLGNPTGGTVVAGSATIGGAGATVTINQSTQNAIINWQQFSIASGELTKFIVPNSSSATLNRVFGGNPSLIYGSLQSNGILYLVNPSGIVVGPSGRIDTSGFLASTLDVSNEQFLAGGNLSFTGASNASIDNEGTIHASSGDVYLIANQVINNGTLSAPQGNVGLAAGSNVLYQPVGTQHLFIQSNPVGTTQAVGITNSGTVRAAAAELRAAGGNAYALAINNTGSIAATGYKKVNGQVYLTSDGGNISNSGQISAQTANGDGGTIVVDGSGTSSTGNTVLNSGTLDASATVAGGSGGSVTLKNMSGTTIHSGKILAKGGQGGVGGNAEVSGQVLQYSGTVDLTAPGGTTGNLLFDPENVIIQTTGPSTTATSGSPTDTFTGDVDDSILTVGDLELALATASVTVTTGGSGSPGSQSGDITVNDALSWSAATDLTLSAYRNITVNASVTNTSVAGAKITLAADNSGTGTGTVVFNNEAQISTADKISLFYNPADNPAGSGINGTSYLAPTDYSGDVTGGGVLSAHMLVNTLDDLQNVQNNLSGTYALGGNIDATATATWNDGAGFVPIGSNSSFFSGTFNGHGYAINGLYINLPSGTDVGLFTGMTSDATIKNVGLTNVQITGNDAVGALVGDEVSGTISNAYSTGVVSGVSNVGGLVGGNGGTVIISYSTATVGGTYYVGGLVGTNYGTISNSYSTGAVVGGIGSDYVGGLVGYNYNNSSGFGAGTITNSYSTGVVSGSSDVGGLLGFNDSTTISNSFWDTDTAGVALGVGTDPTNSTVGVTGATTAELESQTYILNNAPTAPTWDFTNVWTTNGGTTLPQLLGVSPTDLPGIDLLSGTAYIDGGVNDSPDVTIDLIYNGNQIGSTTTSGSGGFSFSISSTDLTGGILLTDATDNGNTYYQANTPLATITGVDLWGGTLRIMADTASNTALKTTAGGLTVNGINYTVSGANLSTNAGVNMAILSNYTLDGNITAAGALSTSAGAALTGGTDVTLTGTSVAMAGTFNLSGSLTVDSTVGDIDFNGVGTLGTAATASGITLNATGAVVLNNSYLTTGGGDFTATGTGDSSNVDGVDVLTSSINTGGGSISLTGQSTFVNNEGDGGNVSGIGVYVDNSILQTASSGSEITSGDITLMGNGSPGTGVTTVNNLVGVYITHSVVSVVGGVLSITGDVNSGTAQAVLNEDGSSSPFTGRSIGVAIDDGSDVVSTGNGSVSITGNTTNSTAELANLGVDLSGLDPNSSTIVTSIVSAAGGLGINITGTAGAVNNSPSGENVETPSTAGVVLEFGAEILAAGSAPITLTGTGGIDENTSDAGLTDESSEGISVEASLSNISGDSPNILISSAGGAISLTGTGGSSIGDVDGIDLFSEDGASASVTSSAANIALHGFAANTADQTSNSNGNGGDAGVDIGVNDTTGSVSTVTALAGSIYINGTVSSGTANSKEAGVVITRGSEITASGTGGSAGATAQGDVTIVGNTTGTTAQSLNGGVFIEGAGTTVSASGIVADAHGGAGLTITGTSDAIDGTTGGTIDQHNNTGGLFLEPFTAGIGIANGATLETLGSAPMTLNGTGGDNANTFNSDTGYADPTTGETSASYGVAIFSPVAEQTTTLSSGGLLSVTGHAGSSPTTGVGVMIGGPSNVGAVSVTSSGAIMLNGTGGALAGEGEGVVPNAGVGIIDPGNDSGTVVIQANGGDLDITGAAGAGDSTGVFMAPYFPNSTSSIDPTITVSGNLNIVSTSGLVNYEFMPTTATNVSVTAPAGTDSIFTPIDVSGPVSLSGGNFNVDESFDAITWGTSLVQNLTVTGGSNAINLGPITATSFSFTGSAAVSINNAIDASGLVTIEDTGANITFGSGGSISDSGGGNNVILAAGSDLANAHYINNNSTVDGGAIQVSGGANFYLYSSDPTYDNFGAITVSAPNVVYGATYVTTGLPAANQELFYVAAMGDVGPNAPGGSSPPPPPPSTVTGGADGGGSNIVPAVLTPQPTPPLTPPSGSDTGTIGNPPPPPPFSFTGDGTSGQTGQQDGGLADSSSNGGQVGAGDAAQLGDGGLNNVANPQAAGALNQALGPIVFQNLTNALGMPGDWTGGNDSGAGGGNAGGGDQETILSGGDVAVIGDNGVKNIPPGQAPPQLQQAMSGDVLNGMSGAGH